MEKRIERIIQLMTDDADMLWREAIACCSKEDLAKAMEMIMREDMEMMSELVEETSCATDSSNTTDMKLESQRN